MRIFENLNVDFLGKRRFFYIVSSLLIIVGLISVFIRGFELGIDFKGGSEVAVEFEKPIKMAEIREKINNIGLGNLEVRTFGGPNSVQIRTDLQEIPESILPQVISSLNKIIDNAAPANNKQITQSTINSVTYSFTDPAAANSAAAKLIENGFRVEKLSEEPDNKVITVDVGIADWIKENLAEKMSDNPFKVQQEQKVGPKIGSEMRGKSMWAVLWALVAILVYLGVRFKFVFSFGAVLALFHDVLITLGLFSLLYGVIPGLNLEISVIVVAAFLTLVGYSINDTVVVFDRVRENIKIHKTLSLEENMNNAINKTMSRTIITGVTTLLVVLVLLVLGGEVLIGFAFALFFGIIIGTYSSIFVASAFVLEVAARSKKKIQF